jgi:aspartate racemase
MKPRGVIGVLGGMGPAATVHFLGRLVALAPAASDRDHPHVLVDSNPHVPDRNAALRGDGPSPGPVLAGMARGLETAGATVLAMPCNAAHAWADDIRAATRLPLIDMVDAACADAATLGARKVGLLAVAATLDAGLYRARLAARGIEVVAPQRAAVATLVARIKSGGVGATERAAAQALVAECLALGADVVIAACTEIPLVLDESNCPEPLVDSSAALARAVLAEVSR